MPYKQGDPNHEAAKSLGRDFDDDVQSYMAGNYKGPSIISYLVGGLGGGGAQQNSAYHQMVAAAAADPRSRQAPQVDDRYKELQKSQIEQAQKFRQGIPTMAEGLMKGHTETSRLDLAKKMQEVTRSQNSRGLLYGGGTQKGHMQAALDSRKELAQKRAQLNTQLLGAADTMDQQAIETGFGMTGAAQNAQSVQAGLDAQAQRNKLAQDQANASGWSGALSGLGGALGGLLGGRPSKQPVITPGAGGTPSGGMAKPMAQ